MSKCLLNIAIIAILFLAFIESPSIAQEAPPIPTVPDNPYAPFIDSYHYAIDQGATAEWSRMEWVALDAVNNRVYYAMSEISNAMSDAEGDIQLEQNLCGAIFMGELDADMNISSISPVLMGGLFDEANESNPCDVDAIANPNNLYVDPQGNLWIGEDSGWHKNNVLWVWNPTTNDLKRFATLPLGAEVAGLHITPDGTVFMNVQHPLEDNQDPFNVATIGMIRGFNAADNFDSVGVPTTEDDMTTVTLAAGDYQVLGRTGDVFPNSSDGESIIGAIVAHDGAILDVCNNPDGNIFLPTGDNTALLYSNFECYVGGASELGMERDIEGNWSVTGGGMLNFIPVHGTSKLCGASVTSWNTGLTSEEDPPDNDEDWRIWLQGQGADLATQTGSPANPFDHGYNIELIPNENDLQIIKHYAMGRFSKEVAIEMPDNKTFYFGDDGYNRIMFKFVADTVSDLSAGTLFAAKLSQDGNTFTVNWIMLGHGIDADIYAAIRALDAEFAN